MSTAPEINTAPRWQPSLRVYLILMNIILLCLLFPTISIFYYQQTAAFRDEQLHRAVAERTAALKNKAAQLVRSMSHIGTQAISEYNFTLLNDLAKKGVINDQEVIGCQFVSRISAGAPQSAGYGFLGIEHQEYTAFMNDPGATAGLLREQAKEDDPLPVAYVDIAHTGEAGSPPGLVAVAPVYVADALWGTVNATFSLELVNRDIMKIENDWTRQMHNYKMSFLTITLIFVGVGVAFAVILTRPLLHSIALLSDGVDRVSSGDLEHTMAVGSLTCDEFVVLSRSFNDMTGSLRQARKQLAEYSRSLEEQVSARTKELQEAQAELVSQAHEAGMAEMAVGVLHNIGNAITPVKVGTSTLIKKLRESPLRTSLKDALAAAPAAVQSAAATTGEEKQRLIAILKLLPDSIREEHDQIIAELEQISDKHKYIENIISLQMHYARLRGRADLVDVNQVARDALDMLSEMILKQNVLVETSLQPVAHVRLEESKLLQIFINLIKNACEAMSGNTDTPKRLMIATSQSSDGEPERVVVAIKDTGCGFSPEEEKHFFSFGYSTKNRGSGFGLHSCANYLIANHGTIAARSTGPGQGAEFIIHLPAAENNT